MELTRTQVRAALEAMVESVQRGHGEDSWIGVMRLDRNVCGQVEVYFSPNVLLVMAGVSLTFDVRLVWRGLVRRGGMGELCNDPDNGKVRWSTDAEWRTWLERFVTTAPEIVRSLHEKEATALLTANAAELDIAARILSATRLMLTPELRSELVARGFLSNESLRVLREAVVGLPELSGLNYDVRERAAYIAMDRAMFGDEAEGRAN